MLNFLLGFSLFLIIKTQCRNETSPSITSCPKYNSGDPYGDFCCFYQLVQTPPPPPSPNPNKCKILPYSALQNVMKYDVIGTDLYKVDCGKSVTEGQSVLSPCGEGLENPNLSGCKTYSSFVDSCCFFDKDEAVDISYPVTQTGCYWLGSKFNGDIIWGSLKLKCSSNYPKTSVWLFAIIIIIHILI